MTTLDEKLQRVMEPRASTPARRLEAIRVLSAAGIPVRVLIAPVVPGLTDHEMPAIAAAAAEAGATAMVDVSDGLLADLGHLARASGVTVDVRTEALEIPEPLQTVSAATRVDPMLLVLTGGEDHAMVATFPPDVKLPARWKVIGEVLNPSALPQVTVDGAPWTSKGGWDHFGDMES